MQKFIFDVDGTLTPSRGFIDKEFQKFFTSFCYNKKVYLVTGSDYPKTLEQLGKNICENVVRVYNCSGNDVWEGGQNIGTINWTLPESAHGWLSEQLEFSAFPLRTGLHLEHRPGMVNFSTVGRNATPSERKFYVEWDTQNSERDLIARNFNLLFPELEARVGGETGIDIYPKGGDKGQIIRDFHSNDELYFFGDRMDQDGNDYPLAKQIIDKNLGKCYHVKDWKDTWEYLKNYE